MSIDTTSSSFSVIDLSQSESSPPIFGTAAADTIYGSKGDDAIFGDAGNDVIHGGTGDDLVTGDDGNDAIDGGAGADILFGGEGDDVIEGGGGSDSIDGGGGHDVARYDGFARSYDIGRIEGYGRVSDGTSADFLNSIETIVFRDASWTFDPDSQAAQVMRLYDSVLNRAPDPMGFDNWLDQIAHGMSLGQVATHFIDSAEFNAATGSLSNSDFVEYLYNHSLGRSSDAQGKALWVASLDQGNGRANVLLGFSESAEHRGLTADRLDDGLWVTDNAYQQVTALYDTFANRLPDQQGLTGWVDALKTESLSLHDVAEGFADSAEFAGRTAGMSNEQLVDFMYLNTLDRAAEPAGKAAWVQALDAGMDRAELLLGFSEAPEHYGLIQQSLFAGVDVLI